MSTVAVAVLLALVTSASNKSPAAGTGGSQQVAAGKPTGASVLASSSPRVAARATTSSSVAPSGTGAATPAGSAVDGTGGTPPASDPAGAGAGANPGAEADLTTVTTRERTTAPPATEPTTTAPPDTAPPEIAPPAPTLTRLPGVESDVFALTNADRAANGVAPLHRDGCLDAEASAWARSMADSTVMAHSSGAGPGVQGCRGTYASWGDNIGHWQPCYPADMEAWWMGSPSHRPHILDPNFTAVGIGVWTEPNGRCWFEVYFGT